MALLIRHICYVQSTQNLFLLLPLLFSLFFLLLLLFLIIPSYAWPASGEHYCTIHLVPSPVVSFLFFFLGLSLHLSCWIPLHPPRPSSRDT